jgi:hypothetical protein
MMVAGVREAGVNWQDEFSVTNNQKAKFGRCDAYR